VTDNDEIVELLREIRDTQRSHLETYRQFTQEALELSRASVSRQGEALELSRANVSQQRGVNWQRLIAFVVYSLALVGAGAFFGSIISDLARLPSP
jgi:hypothetical protein